MRPLLQFTGLRQLVVDTLGKQLCRVQLLGVQPVQEQAGRNSQPHP